jgi:transposase
MPSRGGRHRAESGQSRQRGRAELLRVIELDPHEVGVSSANWTTELLAEYLGKQTGIQVTEETVRVHLHANGYVCKRPTWTLRAPCRSTSGLRGKRLRVEVVLAGATAASTSTRPRPG